MHTLAFTSSAWAEVTGSLSRGNEVAGLLLAGRAEGADGITLLVRAVRWIGQEHYGQQDAHGLSIRSAGYVPILKEAGADDEVPIFFHTHPGGRAHPSESDREVDRQVQELFRLRSRQSRYVSVVVGGSPDAPEFTGAVYSDAGLAPARIDRMRVIGRHLRILAAADSDEPSSQPDRFDRQVRAFGMEGQKQLSRVRAGVVGAGGTGSAVCEQLLRLGVGSIVVIDNDVVTASNLTRIHESTHSDIGRPKVHVVGDEAIRIGANTNVSAIEGNVAWEHVARELRHCDVVFGCTDDDAGRAVLSRLAYWYLIPLIDCGFVIESVDGNVRGLFGRVTTVMPGEACLICRRRVDPIRMRNQLLPSAERGRLADEGYAPGLLDPDPAVVAFTTMTASYAVTELLDRLFAYSGEDAPSELLLRLHARDVRTNRVERVVGHYCDDVRNWGRGDTAPLLGQMWPA
ncbi:MAG: ThiF family adenylyltransferase [Phenylobacterium sp.]|uniref:ThiF family adenylyltransferase n=1 Tax=Phenylobacterium sp. TaxID=1871053 RepID=UPI002734EA7E|nr:ThiF family adenylyltransferase [Phenylobacterium sp.]MDP3175649.1 ThiF family adenylyltransferase [Phenylobacterium sp.]